MLVQNVYIMSSISS